MKTQTIPEEYQHTSPAGAEVRLLICARALAARQCGELKNEALL